MRWFMPVEEILNMPSGDGGYRDTVRDIIAWKELSEIHDRIRKVMQREKINLVPVCIENDLFIDGHHRVMIAVELGLDEMEVTDCLYESGSNSEYEVIGERNE